MYITYNVIDVKNRRDVIENRRRVKLLTMLTDKGYQCDLIGVYLRFSSSRLVYAEAARSFSTIVQAVLYRPMLQLIISNVKVFVNYFEKEH